MEPQPRDDMLKKRLTSAQFADLDEAIQALYKKAEGSDNYTLNVEDDDGTEIKKAKDREKKRADKAEKDAQELRDRLEELERQEEERAGSGGLDAAGVKALKDKHVADLAKKDEVIVKKDAAITKILVKETAARLASSDITTMPEVLAERMEKRLKVEYEGDEPVLRVIDEEGNVTDSKVEDLREEFIANPKFAPIIVASKASGSGASSGNKGSGAPGKKKLDEMSATEEAQFANEHPQQYAEMVGVPAE